MFERWRGWTVEDDPTAGDGDAVVPIALREVGHRDSWEPTPLRNQLRDAVAGSRWRCRGPDWTSKLGAVSGYEGAFEGIGKGRGWQPERNCSLRLTITQRSA